MNPEPRPIKFIDLTTDRDRANIEAARLERHTLDDDHDFVSFRVFLVDNGRGAAASIWRQGKEHEAAKNLGRHLHELGGFNLMQQAFYRLQWLAFGGNRVGAMIALDHAWDGIGEWRS